MYFAQLSIKIVAALYSAHLSAVSPSSEPEKIQVTLDELTLKAISSYREGIKSEWNKRDVETRPKASFSGESKGALPISQ